MFGRKIDELFALRLLASCVKTGNPERTLRNARDFLSKRGRTTEASVVEDIRRRISEFGENLVNAFYGAGALKEDRYHILSIMEEKGGLTPEPIERVIEIEENLRAIKNEAVCSLVLPAVIVVLSAIAGTFLLTRVWKIIENLRIEPPSIFAIHSFVANHPLPGGIAIVAISVFLIAFLTWLVFQRITGIQLKLFELAGVVGPLRQQKVSYAEIFGSLSSNERNKTLRDIYYDIAVLSETEEAVDSLHPLSEKLPPEVASSFFAYIEGNEERRAWNLLKEEMKNTTLNRIKVTVSFIPLIAYFVVFANILFSIAPMGLVMTRIITGLQTLGGGL